MRYRPQAKLYFALFFIDCVILGFCGAHEPDEQVIAGLGGFQLLDSNINSFVWLSRVSALYYFAYFLVITPLLGLRETPLPVPESISTPVLSHPAATPAGATAAPEKKG
jgi:ubiquinol-cytochrome c reductase cytochrome b subunit